MNTCLKIGSRAALIVLGAVGVVGVALADHSHSARGYGRHDHDSDYARVIDVEPIVRRVRVSSPQRECWNEERPVASGPSHTEVRSTIIGGLIGAAVGHRVGMHHRDLPSPVAVVGGSLIGAAIGNSIGADKAARRGEYREVGYESVQRCNVSYRDEWEERVDGYRVTYIYNGREHTTRMPYDPGKRIRVNVDVEPEFERRY